MKDCNHHCNVWGPAQRAELQVTRLSLESGQSVAHSKSEVWML